MILNILNRLKRDNQDSLEWIDLNEDFIEFISIHHLSGD